MNFVALLLGGLDSQVILFGWLRRVFGLYMLSLTCFTRLGEMREHGLYGF